MLNRRRFEVGANLVEDSLARVAIVVGEANLHELVRFQVDVDFMQYRRSDAARPDDYDRVQMMRFGAKHPSRRRCQSGHPLILSRSSGQGARCAPGPQTVMMNVRGHRRPQSATPPATSMRKIGFV